MKKLSIIVFSLLVAATLQACSYSTAQLSDVKLCNSTDGAGNCVNDSMAFKTTDAEIFLSAQLENAPSGTKVTAAWRYLKGELGNEPKDIDSVTAEAGDGGNLPYYSSLTAPTAGWPTGDYEVTLTLSSDNSTPVSKQFSIK
ncbi:MAG: hypothetical protein ACYC6B_09695 [Thermoleophilia bacterium]